MAMSYIEKRRWLLENIRGLGDKKIDQVTSLFDDVGSVYDISGIPDLKLRLLTVFPAKMADSFIGQMKEYSDMEKGENRLMNEGIDRFTATQMEKNHDTGRFFSNPYTMGPKYNVSFEITDAAGHHYMKNGEDAADTLDIRMTLLLDFLMQRLEASGHTYATLEQLSAEVAKYQKRHRYTKSLYRPEALLLYMCNTEIFHIEREPVCEEIQVQRVYRKSTYELESDIAYHVRRLCRDIVKVEAAGPVTGRYDKTQKNAVASVLESGVKIITGPPGSGKTEVIKGLIEYYGKHYPKGRVTLVAPTGRAAKHMSEITGLMASTIHKQLKIGTYDSYFSKQEEQSLEGLVICDESSMLSLQVAQKFFSAVRGGATVYLVGDKDQLPAVGAGDVLHNLMESGILPVFQLTKVYRNDGLILNNAHKINRGQTDVVCGDGFRLDWCEDAEDMAGRAVKEFFSKYNPADPFETQILCPSYRTAAGIDELNRRIQDMIDAPIGYSSGDIVLKQGAKILMTSNDVNGLYQNGTLCIFRANRADGFLVDVDGETKVFPPQSVYSMKLGYAISVHKSQGSEYRNVILCLPDRPSMLLRRDIVYTGVTRAKKSITIYSMNASFTRAVENKNKRYTQTGLVQKLRAADI